MNVHLIRWSICLILACFAFSSMSDAVQYPPDNLTFVRKGCYLMGGADHDCDVNPEERPLHEVCLDEYYIGKYEVTVGEWNKLMGVNPQQSKDCVLDSCPVDNVSWMEVQEYIKRLNDQGSGIVYRLPTEAEWEYAARSGGKREKYSGGEEIDKVAWFAENSGRKVKQVGLKHANSLGLYDMSGNVWEMTNDWYQDDYYSKSPRRNPHGAESGTHKVVRGGCITGEASNLRVTRRNAYQMDYRKHGLGFRVVISGQ